MSYCRFSSDDFQCDVYCYESCLGGWAVHIAGCKYVFAEPLPPEIELGDDNFQAWFDRHQLVSQMVERASLVPIGLSRDGLSFNPDTPGDAADLLESLKAEGYRVPQHAIDALREEAKELRDE